MVILIVLYGNDTGISHIYSTVNSKTEVTELEFLGTEKGCTRIIDKIRNKS